ncbi:hypothetical protein [Candidatus Harpocratesius sp.]
MSIENLSEGGSRFQKYPALHVFIKDLDEGQWIDEEKMVSTRYGRVKRVRVCGTILYRKDPTNENQEESFLDDSFGQNSRISFQIDDGTGRIWITIFGIEIEDYSYIKKGILIEVVGKTRQYRNKISLVGEYARKLSDPNWETYHMLKILTRRNLKPKYEIEKIETPTFSDFNFESNIPQDSTSSRLDSMNIKDEIDMQINKKAKSPSENEEIEEFSSEIGSFSSNDPFEKLNILDKIVEYIRDNDNDDGVAITEIQSTLKLDLPTLKTYLNQLSQDIRIYKTSDGHYSAY